MNKKHVPIKDRPTIVFNGILEDEKIVRRNGKSMLELRILQGSTRYRILADELVKQSLKGIGVFDKFETVQRDFISYIYKKIDVAEIKKELKLVDVTFSETIPSVFKKTTVKETRYVLVGRNINVKDI